MNLKNYTASRTQESLIASHSVLRNTYMLLSLTLFFSALCAYFSMQAHIQLNFFINLAGMFGLLFLTQALRNSIWGIVSTFAFTGFMGFTLGPMLNHYIHGLNNGAELVATALGSTGLIFICLSAYVLSTKKDFNFIGGFLFAGIITAFIAGLAGMWFQLPLLSLVVSGAFVLIASGYILFTTSQIINEGERNYIMATISLYVAIFNLFVNLMYILSALAGNRD